MLTQMDASQIVGYTTLKMYSLGTSQVTWLLSRLCMALRTSVSNYIAFRVIKI